MKHRPPTDHCLSIPEMYAYLQPDPPKELSEKVDRHVAGCELCFGALEQLERSIDAGAKLDDLLAAEGNIGRDLEHMISERSVGYRSLLKYAAIILIIIIPVGLTWWNSLPPPAEGLFADHFSPLDDVTKTRSGELDTGLLEAMSFYNRGEYEQAITHLEALLPKMNVDSLRGMAAYVRLYCGISYLAREDPAPALKHLEVILTDPETLLLEETLWYGSLAYVKQGHFDKARPLLDKLTSEGGNYYKKRATELLDDLE